MERKYVYNKSVFRNLRMKHSMMKLGAALTAVFITAGCATAEQKPLSANLETCRQEFLQKSDVQQQAYLNSRNANWDCVPQSFTDGGQGEEDPEGEITLPANGGYIGDTNKFYPKNKP